ncbi:CapA family protein [Thiopseudomonas alkaliphila]|uniref:CapA family protein n=1 Tax=Thiopseudomonas alkaliphila TaxID=1697053 RepID=UPI00069DB48E|nr:CapA family protein [Thiopseudomonas alkaliphila]AKX52911.1 hypothetical protein AKN91_03945 [Thiopseudomonas alkaliphila]
MRVLIGGDFCPENRAEKLLSNGGQVFSIDYLRVWKSSDFRIVNLEGPITSSDSKIDKVGRHIKFNPSIMCGLKKMGVTHFSLANNHIMDYGERGVNDTIYYLKKYGIEYFGCHAQKESVLVKDDTKVVMLSFSNKEFSLMEDNKGIGACSMDLIHMFQKIEAAKALTKHIVVILHTGLSMHPLPSPEQRKLCKFLIDIGVSVVLCQHSHIMGAYESYKDGFISYGQGSFVFELNRKDSVWNQGYSIDLKIENDKRTVNIIPHRQFDNTLSVRNLTQSEFEQFEVSMQKINKVLEDEDQFKKEWTIYLKKVEKYYFNQFFLPKNRGIRKILNLVSFKNLLSNNKRKVMLNNIRNDEHAEVMKELLRRENNEKSAFFK